MLELAYDFFEDHVTASAEIRRRRPLALGLLALLVGGTSLFRMTRTPHAALWFQHLCRLGVLTRPFDHTPDGLRFGVPSERDLPRLMRALEALA